MFRPDAGPCTLLSLRYNAATVLATIVNSVAVLIGSLIGFFFHSRITDRFKETVYTGIGVITLVIGVMMSLETTRILYVALSVVIGGLLGTWWNVEGGILKLGGWLEARASKPSRKGPRFQDSTAAGSTFAHGFLNASVLFCVGAMTIVGAFRAGVDGDYDLLFTKSVMDGSMAVLLTAAMGPGVACSVIVILIYQGGLTLLAQVISPVVSDLVLSELSGTGGVLILMIALNLLNLRKVQTGNFLPALALVLIAAVLEPVVLSVIPG